MRKHEIELRIAEIKLELHHFELDPDDYEEMFDEMLDDDGYIEILGMQYSRSRVLKEIDPTAYSCSLNDYIDGIDISTDAKYKELEDELTELEDELTELEDE